MLKQILFILLSFIIISCDSVTSFTVYQAKDSSIKEIRANIINSQTGRVIQITEPEKLDQKIINAKDISVILDNSNSSINVTKNADSTLSFPLSQTIQIQSNGYLNVILVADKNYSEVIKLNTGNLVKLKSEAISVLPSKTVLKGSKITLKANLEEKDLAKDILFNWYYSQSTTGPWIALSGNNSQITWETNNIGSYFIKLDMVSPTGTSTYITPNPLVFVKDTDSDDIVTKDPLSGSILRGESINLTANIPIEDNDTINWFYSSSKMGPFLAIQGNTKSIKWTPNQVGDFYIRIKTFNTKTNQTQTYTTATAVVSVKDSDDLFEVTPNPASIKKGESVKLKLLKETNTNIVWYYTVNPNSGQFLPIPSTGKEITWTPSSTGSFYVRAETVSTDGAAVSSFTSATPLVIVSDAGDVIKTKPKLASINLGESIELLADVPKTLNATKFNWSYSSTPNGPWSVIETVYDSPTQRSIKWIPTQNGSFYVKVDVISPQSESVITYTSSTPIVFVNENQLFFKIDPFPAKISTNTPLYLETRFLDTNFIYTWSYGVSTAGPWFSIGGSNVPSITWDKVKPTGSFYIKFDAIYLPTNRYVSFVSKVPLVYVEPSTTSTGTSFGKN